jgi:hypothetical protein
LSCERLHESVRLVGVDFARRRFRGFVGRDVSAASAKLAAPATITPLTRSAERLTRKAVERWDLERFERCGKFGCDKAAHLRVTDGALAEPCCSDVRCVSSNKNGRAARLTFFVGCWAAPP